MPYVRVFIDEGRGALVLHYYEGWMDNSGGGREEIGMGYHLFDTYFYHQDSVYHAVAQQLVGENTGRAVVLIELGMDYHSLISYLYLCAIYHQDSTFNDLVLGSWRLRSLSDYIYSGLWI